MKAAKRPKARVIIIDEAKMIEDAALKGRDVSVNIPPWITKVIVKSAPKVRMTLGESGIEKDGYKPDPFL